MPMDYNGELHPFHRMSDHDDMTIRYPTTHRNKFSGPQ